MDFDIVIVGAGIAGASLGWRLARRAKVLLLEREAQPGYHSTGRSAAMFMPGYGTPQVRALTRASRAFYTQPPAGFAAPALLHPRGVLYVGRDGQAGQLDASEATLHASGSVVQRIDAAQALERVPVLRREGLIGALAEADAMDVDVDALHQAYLHGVRRCDGAVWTDAGLLHARRDAGTWTLTLADGRELRCATLVDAAGAWADAVAQAAGAQALGLQPRRRSAFTFAAPDGLDVTRWPAVVAIDESWYFKPDAGRLLGSPANADAVAAHDVQPEEIDIATGIARIEHATTLGIRRPQRTWAGLRTFARDGDPVIGWDGACEGFFWLAGQGGYGIQSADAAAALAESLLCGAPLPDALEREGVSAAALAPARLR